MRQPLQNPANYKMRSYRYEYKKKDIEEGIDVANQVDVNDVRINHIELSKTERKFL